MTTTDKAIAEAQETLERVARRDYRSQGARVGLMLDHVAQERLKSLARGHGYTDTPLAFVTKAIGALIEERGDKTLTPENVVFEISEQMARMANGISRSRGGR